MNNNRRRNIFTLGDFHQYPNATQQIKAQRNRRQNSDPFERDPFKIQSYNFHYAERPSYPLPASLSNRRTIATHHNGSLSSASNKRFETFFYNHDFTPSLNDKENPPANKFHEFRRRKFLLDNQHQNLTATGLYDQTTTRRRQLPKYEKNMYHHHQQQRQQEQEQLYPIAKQATAATYNRIGRSASQIAIATETSTDFNMREREERKQYHKIFGSPTDTSSIATAAGQSGHRRDNYTTPNQKCDRSMSARSTGNREYIRALTDSQAQTNILGQGRYSSQSSLERRGRRMPTEPMGADSGGNSRASRTHDTAYGNVGSAFHRELSGSRVSPTKYAKRQPLHPIHTASPNRVNATVEKTEGTCSGCQININIKGLDATQLGDNVVIKIEADKNASTKIDSKTEQMPVVVSTLQHIYNGTENAQHPNNHEIAYAKLVEIKRNAEVNQNLDIKPKMFGHQLTSPPPQTQRTRNIASETFMIDKRLSKFAIMNNGEQRERKHKPRSSSYSRIPVTSSTTRAMGLTSFTSALRSSNSSENINRSAKNSSSKNERMPSMVPWCLDTTIRQGIGASSDDRKSLRAQPSNNLTKALRPSYDSTLNDVRKMRRKAILAAYKPLSLKHTSMSPSAQSRKIENNDETIGYGHQRFGGIAAGGIDKKSYMRTSSNFLNNNSGGVQHRQSHHSLRSLKTTSKSTLNSHYSSQLELKNSPTVIIRGSRSCIRTEDKEARHLTDNQSHVSSKTTPLNVNINVFADKLKLLRV